MFTFDADLFSDLHKEVYGFRPRGHWFYDADTTDAERQAEWDHLCKVSERQFREEEEANARKLAQFESDVAKIQSIVNCSREQAIYHYVESLRPDAYDLRDAGYLCYCNDLPYELASVLAPACEELLKVMEMLEDA